MTPIALLFAFAEFGVPIPHTPPPTPPQAQETALQAIVEPLAQTEADIPPPPAVLEPPIKPPADIAYTTGWVTYPKGTVRCVTGRPCDTPALNADPTHYTHNWQTGETP